MLRNSVKHEKPISHAQQRIEVSAADAKRYACGRQLYRAVKEIGTVERLVRNRGYYLSGKTPEPTFERIRYGTITFQGTQGRVLSLSAGRWELFEVKLSE